ncbi:MAG TPA: hypothetical protein VGP99_03305 [Tepidisphaeraceae bacterium]|jgi:hypothetical protein|nr:hypothetical protein [Tepidisphaeraceae bacterium]
MILALLDILAKGSGGGSSSGDDVDSTIKFIFFGIIAFIWFVGWLMAQMKKKADRELWNNPQPQQDWSHLLRDLTAGQSKPYTPSTPAPPPIISPQHPRYQSMQHQPRQQTKSFAQQSPRPFVQQYPQRQQVPQYPQRPLPPRRQVAPPLKAKPFQGPRPIQRKPKPQRRPPAIPPQTMQIQRPPEAQVGLIQDSAVTMGQAGGATSIQTSTPRGAPRVTRSQLRKLILWSEILAPPLSLRETSPK